jgi:hypothetical protein
MIIAVSWVEFQAFPCRRRMSQRMAFSMTPLWGVIWARARTTWAVVWIWSSSQE